MSTGHAQLSSTLRRLLGPGEPEISCEQCFHALDTYVEAKLAGVDPDASVPGMHAHLRGCPACAEEYDSLKALLEQ
jgi:hypothetical protein